MKMLIEFDIDADIIEVPQHVIDNRDIHRMQFLKWLYNKHNKHRYWVNHKDKNGRQFEGVQFRSDAFVEWLNKKLLLKQGESASIVQQYVPIEKYTDTMPSILF